MTLFGQLLLTEFVQNVELLTEDINEFVTN